MSPSKHNGRDMGPNPPAHKGSSVAGGSAPKGADAGGTKNMRADEYCDYGAAFSAPQTGSAKYRPGYVKVVDGKSTPASAATKPASKTKSPQNAT